MIKLGCLVDPAIRQRDRSHTDLVSVEAFVEFARELRLDTIDFHLFDVPMDIDNLSRLKRLCHRNGMPIGYIGRGGGLFGHEIQKGRMTVEMAKREVDAAVIIGAPMVRLRIGGPPDARRPDGSMIEEYWPGMIERLRQISDYAAGKGVIVGAQNHDSGAAISTADDVVRMMREVDRPNFTYIMDCGQWMGSPGGNPIGEVDPNVDIYAYMERVWSGWPPTPPASAPRYTASTMDMKSGSTTTASSAFSRMSATTGRSQWSSSCARTRELPHPTPCGWQRCICAMS